MEFRRISAIASLGVITESGRIWLAVDGDILQDGNLNQMIWKLPEMISYLSGLFTLQSGDLIFTGTPSGVGPVVKGDVLVGGVDGISGIKVTIN